MAGDTSTTLAPTAESTEAELRRASPQAAQGAAHAVATATQRSGPPEGGLPQVAVTEKAFAPFAVSGKWETAEEVAHGSQRKPPPTVRAPRSHSVRRTSHAVISGVHETATKLGASGAAIAQDEPVFVHPPSGVPQQVLAGEWETAVLVDHQAAQRQLAGPSALTAQSGAGTESDAATWSPGPLLPAGPTFARDWPVYGDNGSRPDPIPLDLIRLDVQMYGALGKDIVAQGAYQAGTGVLLLDHPANWPTPGWRLADLVPKGGEIGFGILSERGTPYHFRGTPDLGNPDPVIYIKSGEGPEYEAEQGLLFGDRVLVSIFIDDAPAIQRALSDASSLRGSVVHIPAGVYVLGVPSRDVAPNIPCPNNTNTPLFLKSNTTVFGDGPGKTILRLADNVNQHHPFPGASGSYIFDTVPGSPKPAQSTIHVSDMTLDGNKDGQSDRFPGGGNSALWGYWGYAPYSVSAQAWNDGTSGFDASVGPDAGKPDDYGAMGNGNGKRLAVCVTLSDDFGFETSVSGHDFACFYDDQNLSWSKNHALKVTLPIEVPPAPRPVGASNPFIGQPKHVNVYFKSLGHLVHVQDAEGNWSYQQTFPDGNEMDPRGYYVARFHDIVGKQDHVIISAAGPPVEPNATVPGLAFPAIDIPSGGLRLENVAASDFTNLEIRNFLGYGISMDETEKDKGNPPTTVSGVTFTSVNLHDNARLACAVFVGVDTVTFNGCIFDGSSGGVDFEAAQPANGVSFLGCRFTNTAGIALNLAASSFNGLKVQQCWFEANQLHVKVFSENPDIDFLGTFEDSTFKDSLQHAFYVQHGNPMTQTSVIRCVFWNCGIEALQPPFYAAQSSSATLHGNSDIPPFWFFWAAQDPPNWSISDCFFWPSHPLVTFPQPNPPARPILGFDKGAAVALGEAFVMGHETKSILAGSGPQNAKVKWTNATVWGFDDWDPFLGVFVGPPAMIEPSRTPGKIKLINPNYGFGGKDQNKDPINWLKDPTRNMLDT